VSVAITGDTTAEPDETFFVNLSSATNATIADSQGKGTITNDEAMITINDVSKAEGNTGTTSFVFTVSLSAAMSFPVTVQYKTINGTATSGSDYTALPLATLTFNPGQTSKTVSVAVTGDTTVEPNEKFNVVLGTPTNAVIADGTGIGTILNDDVAALVPSSARETLRQANPARQQGAASLIDIAIERWSEWKSSEEVVLGWETAGLRHRGRYSRMLKRTPLSAAV
jgi:hypothetical protein